MKKFEFKENDFHKLEEYYKAYEYRYKKVHTEENSQWAGDKPSEILADYLEKYGITNNSKILEIGCGEGQNAIFLMKKGYKVYASDVSNEAISWCKKKAKENNVDENFFVMDVLKNNLQEKYDFIYSISTLHMLIKDGDRSNFLNFIYSHLEDDGKTLITIMGDGIVEKNNDDSTKAFDLVDRQFNNKIVKVARTSCCVVNWDTFEEELKKSKLSIIEKFNTSQISGFNNSMVVVCEKE